ncbi:MAG TPA: PAS domain-containing protein, partial [Mucilaginibacter sp.]|nr:PAS domain-containing protein [Mucilaginibacter sp.]
MKTDNPNGLIAAGFTPNDQDSENLRFRKLIENSHDGITLLDNNFNIIFRSNSAERIVGWKTIDRITKNVTNVVHPDCQGRIRECLGELLSDPSKPRTCVFRSKHSEGHYIWLEGIFTNFLDDPDIAAIVCNFRDISESMLNDEKMQQIMQELLAYKHALDESAIVAITDQKGIIQYVNDYFCRISQYSRQELIGQDHRIINSSYHDKDYIRNLWITIARGKVWNGEFRNKAKDGTYYWVDTTIIPFLNDKRKPYQYLSIRWDITAQKKIISALQESEKRYSNLFHLSPLP